MIKKTKIRAIQRTKKMLEREMNLPTEPKIVKITKIQALQRTKKMLEREWNLPTEPASDTDLRKDPPNGLGKNDNQILALEPPIETNDFSEVEAQVLGSDLIKAKTVGELRDQIWEGIPDSHKK